MLIATFISIIIISLLITIYIKFSEKFRKFRKRSFFTAFFIGAAGVIPYWILLYVAYFIMSRLFGESRFALYLLIFLRSAISVLLKYSYLFLVARKLKLENRFLLIAFSMVIGLGFSIFDTFIIAGITGMAAEWQELLFLPASLFSAAVIGYTYKTVYSGYLKLVGGLAAIIIFEGMFNVFYTVRFASSLNMMIWVGLMIVFIFEAAYLSVRSYITPGR